MVSTLLSWNTVGPLWKGQESLTKVAKFVPFSRTILYKPCLFYPSWQATSFERPPSWVAFIDGFHCIPVSAPKIISTLTQFLSHQFVMGSMLLWQILERLEHISLTIFHTHFKFTTGIFCCRPYNNKVIAYVWIGIWITPKCGSTRGPFY